MPSPPLPALDSAVTGADTEECAELESWYGSSGEASRTAGVFAGDEPRMTSLLHAVHAGSHAMHRGPYGPIAFFLSSSPSHSLTHFLSLFSLLPPPPKKKKTESYQTL